MGSKMTIHGAMAEILNELERAKRKFPTFPVDPIHASAIVAEEVGELTAACLQLTYDDGDMRSVRDEAIQVGAIAVRFLSMIDQLVVRPSEQRDRNGEGL